MVQLSLIKKQYWGKGLFFQVLETKNKTKTLAEGTRKYCEWLKQDHELVEPMKKKEAARKYREGHNSAEKKEEYREKI